MKIKASVRKIFQKCCSLRRRGRIRIICFNPRQTCNPSRVLTKEFSKIRNKKRKTISILK